MARPIKEGLDYFPLNVDIDQDDKVAIIEAEHGMLGFGVVIKLLMKIYSEGYYYNWTEKEQILFSRRVNVNINEVNAIIKSCVKWGMFDGKLFEEYKILTSAGIQRRYLEVTKRRKRVEVANQHLLLHNADINSYTNVVYVDIDLEGEIVNDNISTQSKVKESKVKESKVVVEETTATDSDFKNIIQAFENNGFGTINSFTKERLVDLCETYKDDWVLDAIKESVNSNVRNLKYVEAILKRWQAEEKNTGRKGSYGKSKGSNQTDGSEYDEIGLTYEDLQSL